MCGRGVAAADLRRLEGTACMKFAVRKAGDFLFSAEMEIGMLRVTNGPTATAFGQCLDCLAFLQRDHKFFLRWNERLGIGLVECTKCWVSGLGEAIFLRAFGLLRNTRTWAMRFHSGCCGASRKAQAVHLADNGIA